MRNILKPIIARTKKELIKAFDFIKDFSSEKDIEVILKGHKGNETLFMLHCSEDKAFKLARRNIKSIKENELLNIPAKIIKRNKQKRFI